MLKLSIIYQEQYMLKLIIRFNKNPETSFRTNSPEIILGRTNSTKNPDYLDLSPDESVSRMHARIFFESGTWWLEDKGSKAGTRLNGKIIAQKIALSSGDTLYLGKTTIKVEFAAPEEAGYIDEILEIDETKTPTIISEDQHLAIFARLSELVAYSESLQNILQGFISEIRSRFPLADNISLALIENNELIIRASWPPFQAHLSFTLANKAIAHKQAFRWILDDVKDKLVPSVTDATSALYVPMIFNSKIIGLIHLDTSRVGISFSELDLQLLSVIANIIAPSLKASERDELPETPSVFISYSHKDIAFVKKLASDLRRRKIKVWYDERLREGEVWRNQLALSIKNTDVFLLILSPTSTNSEYVEWELTIAQSLHKKILPVMYEKTPLPLTILPLQYFSIGQDYQEFTLLLAERIYKERT
ncbi:TIR domain-containing protein (plasmid) [Candidatus Chlorohelix allophototropha]|nr:TIR domain-containing protein [Chloroflexota bacterium L227-S17]